ncbi:MAG TPA: enoyl-CoA hydratase-related protein [Rugosimonospora sp.]|nr:enoyl-CoA hydratase-related protein [Rugosimonospora sp.]
MSEYRYLQYETDGPVTVITINRPERMNAIGPDVHSELVHAWDRFRTDGTALVGVLTGAGTQAFCAGGDLKSAFAGEGPLTTDPAELAAHARGERPGILGPTRWTDLYKPTIAAVNGVAYAGGLEWVCWTHLAVADAHATFGVTCRRWNIGLGDGGTQRLPRIVGYRRALELIITGRVIDATEALAIGLVNEVVPSGTCRQRAVELAHRIAALPQPAIHTDLEAAERGWGRPLDDALRIEAACFNRLMSTPEIREGLRQFNERDHPDRDPHGTPLTVGLARPVADPD